MGGAGSAQQVQQLPPARLETVFDCVIGSEPTLAGAYGARRTSKPSAPPSVASVREGAQIASGRIAQKCCWLEGPAGRSHGTSLQDVRNTISDILLSFAFDSVTRPSSFSNFICVVIDPWSPRGVCIADEKSMPTIPEDQLLAWCARDRIRTDEDCRVESIKILRLLASSEVALGLDTPRRRRVRSRPSLPGHSGKMLPQRGDAIRRKRIVPIGLMTDDRVPCEHRRGSSQMESFCHNAAGSGIVGYSGGPCFL
ncbi:unnamed protein product [Prorocentrum cordatum]|uniref:Uncharacterized protein n=1 Tax=Prorocentrum cordatum TaxID=2364126 RepID=A0ABN9USR9_9DINO|nr:unnamed protein product [Polarella glacialis]